MREPDCTDVCEIIISHLKSLGFKISDDVNHTDIINALNKCSITRDMKDENGSIIVIDVEQFMRDNFEGEIPTLDKKTRQLAKEFQEHLEEGLSAWITDEWYIF
jgi:hypothetical protein